MRSQEVWNPVEENFKRKLSLWKRNYLSLGGRITLIKASSSNFPVYYMSLLRMPVAVKEKLDRLRRDFLWGGRSDKRKLHLVKWEDVVKSKVAGGLGLCNLEFRNWALLAKWWWRFWDEREALWRRVIRAKYGEDIWGWEPSRVPRHRLSGLWGNILRFEDPSFAGRELFRRGVGFKV